MITIKGQIRSTVFVALGWILSALSSSPAFASEECRCTHGKATVAAFMTDGLGHQIYNSDVSVKSFLSLDSGKNFKDHFHEKGETWFGTRIPYGHYRIRMGSNKTGDIETPINVVRPFVGVEVPSKSGTVHVQLLSDATTGPRPLTKQHQMKIYTFSREDTDYSKEFKLGEASGIPYGIYELEARGPDSGVVHRTVNVFSEDTWVQLGVSTWGQTDNTAPTTLLQGRVSHIPSSEKPVYIKMVGLYCESIFDTRVAERGESDGDFSLLTFTDVGPYLLFTFGRSGILDVREITIPNTRETEVDIDLNDAHRLFKAGSGALKLP